LPESSPHEVWRINDGASVSRIIDPPKAQLLPGEAAHFKTSFDHLNEAASGVVVTFSPRHQP
jgi:hypothetical protein